MSPSENSAFYRAAYFLDAVGVPTVLTAPEYAGLPDDALLAEAIHTAYRIGLIGTDARTEDMVRRSLVIGYWYE
ncbi:MAG: hypothetical protein M0Z36_09940 [Thermaerobacter sp.]|nr:hypothetical protein [Thermaerobacter sp.]